uniref:EamA domain-containing protein n=2 Tax=Spongospora subterranea TaxID=70186 RepID=A0A0H5RCJ3_9EUKA|eukprot:CRZ11297.1 hypothetical protein [Spongospora subterranea]
MISHEGVKLKRILRGLQDRRIAYVIAYITLWSAQALLIKASVGKGDPGSLTEGKYSYEILAVTLSIETFKLIVALGVYLFTSQEASGSLVERKGLIIADFRNGLFLIVPAAIYVLYNGLAFVNLRLMDPATYRVLVNSRIIFSGVLLQYFFKRLLSVRQWLALLLLLFACVVEQSDTFALDSSPVAIIMMAIQGICSSFGSVYFQWLLQKKDHSVGEMGMWLKNIFLYFWSIVFNLVAVICFRPDLIASGTLFRNFDLNVVPIIIAAGLGGVCTSLLLRHLDVLIKEYANFAEMVVIAVAQHILFGVPLRATLLLAIVMVSVSLYMYQTAGNSAAEPVSVKLSDLRSAKPLIKTHS